MNARVRPASASGTAGRTVLAFAILAAAGAACAEDEEPEPARPALHAGSYTEVAADVPAAVHLADARTEAMRWTPTSRRTAVGWGVGMTQRRIGLGADQIALVPSVGVSFRSDLGARRRIDVATWHDLAPAQSGTPAFAQQANEALVTTRVEMQFASQKSKFGLSEFGAIGMQMSSNAKLQLRIRKGGPMVYYRSKF